MCFTWDFYTGLRKLFQVVILSKYHHHHHYPKALETRSEEPVCTQSTGSHITAFKIISILIKSDCSYLIKKCMKIIYTVLKASPLNVVCLESVDVVNSIYYTINSYLDLGTGVLILWYGGILAMEGKDGLTPGIDVIYITYGCAYVYDR
jgi:hypothetical protein